MILLTLQLNRASKAMAYCENIAIHVIMTLVFLLLG